ncbi:hypothetical protein CVT24_007037 [Panaeolus cyanescens]|uniref:DUF6535 domain-containing protein n=1 Tax=Panaeolus cyanescens TaxID=181874 RepID=A0A409W9Z3_9AGAR|nr:hypothetical protein CVT24_007037 [Panaeolus cyanescens]
MSKQPDSDSISSANLKRQCKPGEKCTFDGSDYPSWLSSNPYASKLDDVYQHPLPFDKGNPWEKSVKTVKDFDDGICDAWVDEIQYMLVYAGLFSAVVGAFAVETQKLLQPDPGTATVLLLAQIANQLGTDANLTSATSAPFQYVNQSDALRINVLMIVSLLLSLGVALLGIIVLQWIRSYRNRENLSPQDNLALRQSRYEGLLVWKVPEIITSLPLLLQSSLVLFFVGLIDFLRSSNGILASITGAIVALILGFVVFTSCMPFIYALCLMIPGHTPPFLSPFPAYQSPQSWLIFRCLRPTGIFVSHLWLKHVKGLDAQLIRMQMSRWAEVGAWKDFVLSSNGTIATADLLDKSLVWLVETFSSFESFCNTYRCLLSLTGSTLISVADKIVIPHFSLDNTVSFSRQEVFSLDDPLRRQVCLQQIYRYDWHTRRGTSTQATQHYVELLNNGLCSILQAMDAMVNNSAVTLVPVHNRGAGFAKAFQSITEQYELTIGYTEFNDDLEMNFKRTWLFTFVTLLRSGMFRFQLSSAGQADGIRFTAFWRKLLDRQADLSPINECIEGIVTWMNDFDPEDWKEGEGSKEESELRILERVACVSAFLSVIWLIDTLDMEEYPSILLFISQFLDDAKCHRIWDRLNHADYAYAAPFWNSLMLSLGDKYYQSLSLPSESGKRGVVVGGRQDTFDTVKSTSTPVKRARHRYSTMHLSDTITSSQSNIQDNPAVVQEPLPISSLEGQYIAVDIHEYNSEHTIPPTSTSTDLTPASANINVTADVSLVSRSQTTNNTLFHTV